MTSYAPRQPFEQEWQEDLRMPTQEAMTSLELVISIIGGIVGLGIALYAGWRHWTGRLFVVRIRAESDAWFSRSIRLYEDTFPDWERDEGEEIARWLSEWKQRVTSGDDRLHEYLFAAVCRQRVCGFFFGTYYKFSSTLFVSYLIIPRRLSERVREQVGRKLIGAIRAKLKTEGHSLERIIAEVESPVAATSGGVRRHRKSRIIALMRLAAKSGIPLRVLDVPYVQPQLDLRDRDKREDAMLLLYASLSAPAAPTVPRATVEEIVSVVYAQLYGDCFMTDPEEDRVWRRYLRELEAKIVASLPDAVSCKAHYRDLRLTV